MTRADLSLASIDKVRHLVVSEVIMKAATFAARAGHTDTTACRFVTALVMVDALADREKWPPVLTRIMDLERSNNEKETQT